MAETSSLSAQPPADVIRAAEIHRLGGLRRTLTQHRKVKKKTFETQSHVYEFDEGFIYQEPGGVPHAYPLRNVSVVYLSSTAYYINGGYTHTSYHFDLRLRNGGKLSASGTFYDPKIPKAGFTGKKWVPASDEYEFYELISAVSVSVSKALLPSAVARLEQGGELVFGGMRISTSGVRIGTETNPWDAVKDVRTRDGNVQFKLVGKLRPLVGERVGKVPNLPLFFALVEILRRS